VNRLSVITPVRPDRADHLGAAYESLRSQSLPDGWCWEWIVQEDGQTGAVAALLPDGDDRISLGTGRRGGTAITRNMALTRASGRLIKVLDHDDVLIDGALAREIEVFAAHDDVHWTACRALDLLPDGSTAGFAHDPPAGRLDRGSLLAHWRANDRVVPVHAATLCIRRELLIALGGWMALPASEDVGLVLAADALTDGWFIGQPGLLYRKWPAQTSAQPEFHDQLEWDARTRLIGERAQHLAAVRDTGRSDDIK